MILLISPSSRARECAEAIEEAIGESVEVAANVRRACSCLRHSEFTAVIIDEPVLEVESDALEIILQGSGIAVPIYVNIAISSCQRLIAEVKNGIRRYNEARLAAMRSAAALLKTELRGAVAGILLSTELALRVPSVPRDAVEKLKSVCQLAGEIRTRLESA